MVTSGWSWEALTYGAFSGGPNDVIALSINTFLLIFKSN